MIRILIADDHAIVREGLKQIIAETPDMVVSDEAENGSELLQKVLKSSFDVVFISVILAELPGLDVLEKIKQISPETQVIMMTGKLIERDLIEEIKQKGASGYLQKPFSMEDAKKCLSNLFS